MKHIDQIIIKSFYTAFDLILKDISENEFRHINESVFRYFFIRALPNEISKEDEWKRIDLLLHNSSGHYPIEFKFYDRRPLNRFDGGNPYLKGGPGSKNFKEFLNSCNTLVDLDSNISMSKLGARFKDKYFILVAADRKEANNKFSNYYGGKHIIELNNKGISVDELAKTTKIIESLIVFGWVIKLKKI